MPNWQFLVVRHFGGSQQRRLTCAAIKQRVEQRGLANFLPLVKYEVGRAGEYYLGVALDADTTDNCDPAELARNLLHDAGVHTATNTQLSWVVTPEQVQGLLRGTLECASFTLPMAYEPMAPEATLDAQSLLAELDGEVLQPHETDAEKTSQYEKLLYWCSAVGAADLARLHNACHLLGFDESMGKAWSVLRRLVLSGHAEFDPASLRWSLLPATLVETAADSQRHFLVGQRSHGIVGALRAEYGAELVPQPDGPPVLYVGRDAQPASSEMVGKRFILAGPVAERLAGLLPSLVDWTSRLPTWEEKDFGRFDVEVYNPDTATFEEHSLPGAPTQGLYRFSCDVSGRRTVTVAFFDGNAGRWACGDFYGLRFVARVGSGMRHAIYRSEFKQLLIPAVDRWPMPYERALVLASGILPDRLQPESAPPLLVYEGITCSLAERLSTLLGVEVEGV